MAGITASYINWKLAAEGTTQATRDLILAFLNDAPNAAAIAGVEPGEGPIVDDPTEGFGDQVRDYDIGIDVAQRIIDRRNSLGGFTVLTQLAGISHFGRDKLHDLIYSLSRTVHAITAIRFDWNSATIGNDALSLRRNYSTDAPSPSWQLGVSSNYADSPACYAIKETVGNTLAIRVALRANGLSGAYVRALGGNRLGPVAERFVSFNSSGYSGYETFELATPTFHAYGIDGFNARWRWQWREKPGDTWRELLTTRHRVYVILRVPTLPWVQTAGSMALPWTDALEIACGWAKGATDAVAAATAITAAYNGSGRVSYDTVLGQTKYGAGPFNLTQMLARINGGVGLGEKVNCTDSANTVSTLANLVGCDLWQSRMGSSFDLNAVIAVGYGTWAVPFNGGFNYHEVAWTGACTEYERVYDGCLQVDGDADPTAAPHTPLLPVDMVFGNCTAMDYRLRLCPPSAGGCNACQPKPLTSRQRRSII
ncbi:MAG: hypothetical protein EOM91_14505 [Sphingobacteriia bacterium]|nr:hypothetical protein [Sphingobacteriia bacterium]